MCGRFSLAEYYESLNEYFRIDEPFDDIVLNPRYNIAPTQYHPVIIKEDGKNMLKLFRWGLIPSWAKDMNIDYKMINARAETVEEKPSYKKPFRSQRCLVPADGFYEWDRKQKPRVPYRFIMKDKKPFAFAGLWDKWDKEEEPLYTFTIITTENNELIKPIHNRMPVILDRPNHDIWLNPESNEAELKELLRPFDPKRMDCFRVSTVVNNARNDVPECIKPVIQ